MVWLKWLLFVNAVEKIDGCEIYGSHPGHFSGEEAAKKRGRQAFGW
jgi:hypothetical protein